MKVLPASTEPPDESVERRHHPVLGRYTTYLACLRWEFGFTCAFCLVHEADLVDHGVLGSGLGWIEHRQPQSSVPDAADTYTNCYYTCRYCNHARGNCPVIAGKRQLLDPCTDVWRDHFERLDDDLRPRAGDFDAAYTHEAYDLDDPRKQRMRQTRRANLSAAISALEEDHSIIFRLLEEALRHNNVDAAEMIRQAQFLDDIIRRARREIRRYAAVPDDADAACRCQSLQAHSLPQFLSRQCRDVEPMDD